MRTVLLLILLIPCIGYTQKSTDPDFIYVVIRKLWNIPRQAGKLEIVRNSADKKVEYLTDNIPLFLNAYTYANTVGELSEARRKDSLATLLFENGLLTGDLLLKSLNDSAICVNKDDTLNLTQLVKSSGFNLYDIEVKQLPRRHKNRKYTLFLRVKAVILPVDPFAFGISLFDLCLESTDKTPTKDLVKFLKTAKIKFLDLMGGEI